MSESIAAVAAVLRRDARVFLSYRARTANQLVSSGFQVVLFYELAKLVGGSRFASPAAYFAFASVGLATVPLLRSGLVAPVIALREEMIAGTFERLALSPVGLVTCLLATLVFPFLVALATGAFTLLVSGVAFGLRLHWSTVALAVPLSALGACALAPLAGVVLGGQILVKQMNAGAQWVFVVLALLGGVYFPVSVLPDWARWASDVQPVTPALDLLRHSLLGTALHGSAAVELARLAAWALLGLPVAAVAIRAASAAARRRGTLLEY